MGFKLTPIDVVENINREDFYQNYLKPRRPVVIKGLTRNWPARDKWSLDYMKETVGDIVVPCTTAPKPTLPRRLTPPVRKCASATISI